jgi:hypothetical protein
VKRFVFAPLLFLYACTASVILFLVVGLELFFVFDFLCPFFRFSSFSRLAVNCFVFCAPFSFFHACTASVFYWRGFRHSYFCAPFLFLFFRFLGFGGWWFFTPSTSPEKQNRWGLGSKEGETG